MRSKAVKTCATLLTAGFVALVYAPVSQAVNFGDMMSPGKWFGGKRDRDYDDYGPYGYDGPPPPGYGGWGPGFGGAPYGYGGPYGGYGAPGYGAPYGGYGAPGYGAPPAPAPAAAPATRPTAPKNVPSSSSSSSSGERERIRELERRIEELEADKRAEPPPEASWPSSPAFRPYGAQ